MDSLERLQGLHADLQAFTDTRLANIDRLCQELEDSVHEFQKLLDKNIPSSADRESYNAGKLTFDDQEYGINDDFRHLSRAIGTALELDEVEAGRLLIEGNADSGLRDDYLAADAISRFHDRRDLRLQALRITLEESLNSDQHDALRLFFRDIIVQILDTKTGPPSNASGFVRRCINTLQDLENWLAKINEQIQSKQLLSQLRGPEFYATLEFQKSSLFKQHEALSAIIALLFRGHYATSEDTHRLYDAVGRWQRLDVLWLHYLPAFSAAFRTFGSPEGSASIDDSKRLDRVILGSPANTPSSPARPLHAILDLWWTAEYSGWFREPVTQDKESEVRVKRVKSALNDHALEFLLSVCSGMHPDMWRNAARQELVALLINHHPGLAVETDQKTSSYFYVMLMESLEAFSEAWITNMPDSIRQLKSEEDEQRLLQITAAQDGIVNSTQQDHMDRLHLESFLVLIAFALEGRPEAAEQFWEDPDGNLYGFVTWASKRQTVPRVSAFCEMLSAISEGPENAQAAHKFLLDENAATTTITRVRRVPTMNYQQIFAELGLYARKVHDKTPAFPLTAAKPNALPDLNEVESPVMLACYLRLLQHMFRQNPATRQYVLTIPDYSLPATLLTLASGPIPTYLRAAAFRTLEALLTDKDPSTANNVWLAIDEWASKSHDVNSATKTNQPAEQSVSALQATLTSISTSFDQYDAFVDLLRCLLAPSPTTVVEAHPLPFPADLGQGYRKPGIAPYVDFVCGQVFVRRIHELGDDTQALICSFHCLDFMAVALEGFNEQYVTMLDKTSKQPENSMTPVQDLIYARGHPFGRIVQWLFTTKLNRALLQVLQRKSDNVESAMPDAPVVSNLVRAIDIINLVFDLQATYFDLVRPIQVDTDMPRGVEFIGFTRFEEAIISHPEVVLDLCQYAASVHLQLSLRALALLQKLTSSPRLNNQFSMHQSGQARRLLDTLGSNVDSTLLPVAESLSSQFQVDVRELEDGFEAPGYLTKDAILAFLNACLAVQTEHPSIAYILLGFGRIGDRLTMTQAIDDGQSLVNAIARLVIEYPDGQNGDLVSWLIHLKSAGIRVLQLLWTNSVSTEITTGQLRRSNFLATEFNSQTMISQNTVWDGFTVSDPNFWFTTSAEALTEFFTLRACFYDYVAREIKSIGQENLIGLQRQTISTLHGKTVAADGGQEFHMTIFDMFDFANLDIAADLNMPELQYFADFDLHAYTLEATAMTPILYDTGTIRALLIMTQSQMAEQQLQVAQNKAADEDPVNVEIDVIVGRLEARNRWALAHKARGEALRKYVDMTVSAVHNLPSDANAKTQFVLHILQIILPKFDTFIVDEAPEAIELARAADALLLVLTQETKVPSHARIEDTIAERLFQLFRICIEGIPLSNTGTELRTVLYNICSQYLTRITSSEVADSDPHRKARSRSMDCIRSASQRLISIISDDAEDGTDTCRLNALSLLSMLTSLARLQKSSLIIDLLVKANIIEILLEPLRTVSAEFACISLQQRRYLLTLFESRMFLLLHISLSRSGASALLDAGLLQSLRDSMIFRADPDLGMDLDTAAVATPASSQAALLSTSALHNYFTLLSSSLRVLLSTFLSRGPENEQTQLLIRSFLADHRANMVGVFKRAIGVSGGKPSDERMKSAADESVRCYTGLAVGCGFLDFEDNSALNGLRSTTGFS